MALLLILVVCFNFSGGALLGAVASLLLALALQSAALLLFLTHTVKVLGNITSNEMYNRDRLPYIDRYTGFCAFTKGGPTNMRLLLTAYEGERHEWYAPPPNMNPV